jgi:hypothetical protein
MRVIGVDPAPTKGMAVFDGRDRHIPVQQSRAFVNELNTVPDLLICWDSPLTGPPGSVVGGAEADGSAFSQRAIESFFSRAQSGFKTPRGISVRGYSGCPHWAMSRSLIGLPRTGPFDKGTLPFRLVTDGSQRPVCGRSVVEVHPALALWLWCRDEREADASWDYKRDDSVREDLWKKVFQVPAVSKVLSATCPTAPSSDDVLDARVAYALGRLWLENPRSVVLLGDFDKGTFLVPRVDGLEAAFRSFSQKLPNTPLQPTASGG